MCTGVMPQPSEIYYVDVWTLWDSLKTTLRNLAYMITEPVFTLRNNAHFCDGVGASSAAPTCGSKLGRAVMCFHYVTVRVFCTRAPFCTNGRRIYARGNCTRQLACRSRRQTGSRKQKAEGRYLAEGRTRPAEATHNNTPSRTQPDLREDVLADGCKHSWVSTTCNVFQQAATIRHRHRRGHRNRR